MQNKTQNTFWYKLGATLFWLSGPPFFILQKTLRLLKLGKLAAGVRDFYFITFLPCLPRKKADVNGFKNFIFMRSDGKLGDAVISSFFLKSLKKAYPQCRIIVVCSSKTLRLFKQNKYVDGIILSLGGIAGFIDTIRRVNYENADIIFDAYLPRFTLKQYMFYFFVRAKNIIGVNKAEPFVNAPLKFDDEQIKNLYIKALNLLNVSHIEGDDLCLTPHDSYCAQEIRRAFPNKKIIVFSPFGALMQRSFCRSQIAFICAKISQMAGCKLVLTATSSQKKLLPALPSDVFVAYTDIMQLCALIKDCDQLICTDSAPSHIAAVFQKPSLVFFASKGCYGQGTKEIWRPANQNAVLVEAPANQTLCTLPVQNINAALDSFL